MTESNDTMPSVWRRGLIAGAAALIAGIVAHRTVSPVAATSGLGVDGTFILGSNFNVGNAPNTATQGSAIAAGVSFSGQQVFTLDAAYWGLRLIHWIHTHLGAVAVIPWNPKRQKTRTCLPPTWTIDE